MSKTAICVCGKIAYTYREACEVIADAHRTNHFNHKKHIPKRKYYCDMGNCWHVTSDKGAERLRGKMQ